MTDNNVPDKDEIEVITRKESLIKLERNWNFLISNSNRPSFFSSFIFVKTAWEHFNHSKRDRLFVLIIRRNSKIIAIAPFRIETQKGYRAPLRSIRMISEWNGDRPLIATCEAEETVWKIIFQFLENDFKDWDRLDLAEIESNCFLINQNKIRATQYQYNIEPETISYYIANCGWDNYLKRLGKSTKKTMKRKEKKLSNISGKLEFQCHKHSGDIKDAFNRFVAIEQSGWKKGKAFSVGGNKIQRGFYQDLLFRLAAQEMVSIYILSIGGEDISAEIVYHCNETSYLAHTTYNEKFAEYSPGAVLERKVIENLMTNSQCKEIDMLGMQNQYGDQQLKRQFATNSRKTYRVRIQKRNIRWLLSSLKRSKARINKKPYSAFKVNNSSPILNT